MKNEGYYPRSLDVELLKSDRLFAPPSDLPPAPPPTPPPQKAVILSPKSNRINF